MASEKSREWPGWQGRRLAGESLGDATRCVPMRMEDRFALGRMGSRPWDSTRPSPHGPEHGPVHGPQGPRVEPMG